MSRIFLPHLTTTLALAAATIVLTNPTRAEDPPLWAWRQHDLRQVGLSLKYEEKIPLPDYCRGEIAIRRNLRASYQYEIFYPVPDGVPRIPLPYTTVHVVVERQRGKLVATVRYLDDDAKEAHPKDVLKDLATHCIDLMEQVGLAIQIANLQHTPDLPKVTPPPNVPEPPPPPPPPPPPCLPAKEAPRPNPPPKPAKPKIKKSRRFPSIEVGAGGAVAWTPGGEVSGLSGLFLRTKWVGVETHLGKSPAASPLTLLGCKTWDTRQTFESCGLLRLGLDHDPVILRGGARLGLRVPPLRGKNPVLFRIYADLDVDAALTSPALAVGMSASSRF